MTLRKFLKHHTEATELCVICNPWRIATAWVDHEDLFLGYVDKALLDSEVQSDKWDRLEIVDEGGLVNGKIIEVPAHYIWLKT